MFLREKLVLVKLKVSKTKSKKAKFNGIMCEPLCFLDEKYSGRVWCQVLKKENETWTNSSLQESSMTICKDKDVSGRDSKKVVL